jgi:hydrogenase maturation factor
MASSMNHGVMIDEKDMPVRNRWQVCAVCGFNPLYLANEGKY